MTESKKTPEIELKVLGTRGSMPGEGGIFSRYGGSTSCYLVKIGKEEIYLDAGSGIIKMYLVHWQNWDAH